MSEGAVAPPAVGGLAAEDDTMIIKKSCVYRAKFEIEKEVYISPLGVVPHPMNRGGDPVKVLRCRSITKDVAMYGCDVNEAEQNAVLIESPPDKEAADEVRRVCCNPDYDAHFAKNAPEADDMCIKYGIPIEGGSVSHTHLNVTHRNMLTHKVGCECERTPVVTGGGESGLQMRKCCYLR